MHLGFAGAACLKHSPSLCGKSQLQILLIPLGPPHRRCLWAELIVRYTRAVVSTRPLINNADGSSAELLVLHGGSQDSATCGLAVTTAAIPWLILAGTGAATGGLSKQLASLVRGLPLLVLLLVLHRPHHGRRPRHEWRDPANK